MSPSLGGRPTPTSRARSPRGRPQRLAVDSTGWDSGTYESTPRIAWLLAMTRLHSPATAADGRKAFIMAMGERGVLLDASRVSRIETGEQPASSKVIAGYEQVTGVPGGSLHAASALLRASCGLPSEPDKGTPYDVSALDQAFERIDHEKADGHDWLRVGEQLDQRNAVYLPPSAWSSLSSQLVEELTRSTGVAHLLRHTAAAKLMSHPAGQRHLTMAVGRFVMNRDVQSVAPALSLLQEVADRPTGDLLVRLMGESNPLLSRGAAGVAAALAARDSFADSDLDQLERHVALELSRVRVPLRRADAIDLASRLPAERYTRVVGAIPDPRTRAAVTRACTSHELVERPVSRAVCESMATYAETHAGRRASHEPDQMLRRLVREALFHIHRDRRQLAAITLAASPYARPIAEACLALAQDTHEVAAAMAWSLLRRLGHVLDRGEVAELALEESRVALSAPALVALGVSRGELPEAAATQLLDTARTRHGTRLGHAATFALGMSGHAALQTLATDEGPWLRAAQWWTSVGPALHD